MSRDEGMTNVGGMYGNGRPPVYLEDKDSIKVVNNVDDAKHEAGIGQCVFS